MIIAPHRLTRCACCQVVGQARQQASSPTQNQTLTQPLQGRSLSDRQTDAGRTGCGQSTGQVRRPKGQDDQYHDRRGKKAARHRNETDLSLITPLSFQQITPSIFRGPEVRYQVKRWRWCCMRGVEWRLFIFQGWREQLFPFLATDRNGHETGIYLELMIVRRGRRARIR